MITAFTSIQHPVPGLLASLWLAHAEQYGGQHRMLLLERRWNTSREAFLARRGLPRKADEFIARTLDHLSAGLQAVDAAVAAGDLQILANGRILLEDDPSVTVERSDAQALRTHLYERVGRVQLPALLLEIDSVTHFSWELRPRTKRSRRANPAVLRHFG